MNALPQQGIAALRGVPGRMERLDEGQPFMAVVDFAHTPNSLRRSLTTAKQLTSGRVIAVFGCAGLRDVEIFASGGLDEYEIERILNTGAPITGFGVGTYMGVARDQPYLDMAYKLTEYAGKGRVKISPGKPMAGNEMA